ncbi:MAG: hypothetical protein KAW41_05370 [Candidatus Diapherotrites archaeon]|nr:hypothetical protein [Candidatus Diapherotrites archaeon]
MPAKPKKKASGASARRAKGFIKSLPEWRLNNILESNIVYERYIALRERHNDGTVPAQWEREWGIIKRMKRERQRQKGVERKLSPSQVAEKEEAQRLADEEKRLADEEKLQKKEEGEAAREQAELDEYDRKIREHKKREEEERKQEWAKVRDTMEGHEREPKTAKDLRGERGDRRDWEQEKMARLMKRLGKESPAPEPMYKELLSSMTQQEIRKSLRVSDKPLKAANPAEQDAVGRPGTYEKFYYVYSRGKKGNVFLGHVAALEKSADDFKRERSPLLDRLLHAELDRQRVAKNDVIAHIRVPSEGLRGLFVKHPAIGKRVVGEVMDRVRKDFKADWALLSSKSPRLNKLHEGGMKKFSVGSREQGGPVRHLLKELPK